MNDRKEIPASLEPTRANPLISDFCHGLKELKSKVATKALSTGEAEQEGKDLFQLLLERNGLPIDLNNYAFWDDISKYLQSYFTFTKNDFEWLTKVQMNERTDQWAMKQVSRYRRELNGPAPISPARGSFSSRILRFF